MRGSLRFASIAKIVKRIYAQTDWRGAMSFWNFHDSKILTVADNAKSWIPEKF